MKNNNTNSFINIDKTKTDNKGNNIQISQIITQTPIIHINQLDENNELRNISNNDDINYYRDTKEITNKNKPTITVNKNQCNQSNHNHSNNIMGISKVQQNKLKESIFFLNSVCTEEEDFLF